MIKNRPTNMNDTLNSSKHDFHHHNKDEAETKNQGDALTLSNWNKKDNQKTHLEKQYEGIPNKNHLESSNNENVIASFNEDVKKEILSNADLERTINELFEIVTLTKYHTDKNPKHCQITNLSTTIEQSGSFQDLRNANAYINSFAKIHEINSLNDGVDSPVSNVHIDENKVVLDTKNIRTDTNSIYFTISNETDNSEDKSNIIMDTQVIQTDSHLGITKNDVECEFNLEDEQRMIEFMSLVNNLKFHSHKSNSTITPNTDIQCDNNTNTQIDKQRKPRKLMENRCSYVTKSFNDKHYDLPRSPKSINLKNGRIPSPLNNGHTIGRDDEELIEELLPPPPPMDWKTYHRLDEIYRFIEDLECDHPALCSVIIIGQSVEGRNIKILKISNGMENNTPVWIDAGIHAREWIGPAVNTYIANHIVKNFKFLPEHVTNKDWYFLPVANPDGYEYTHTSPDNRLWRKNRARVNGECVGVDLNRNFSYGWGCGGSSGNPYHSFYRGLTPFSEPESKAIKKAILFSGIKYKVYLSLHSYGQKIIFPFSCREELCPSYIRLLGGATTMSKAIYETNGHIYKAGTSGDMMYRAAGTSHDWCYGTAHVPYSYLIELCNKKHKFKMPMEDIEKIGKEILNCVVALMEFVDTYPFLEEESCKSASFTRKSVVLTVLSPNFKIYCKQHGLVYWSQSPMLKFINNFIKTSPMSLEKKSEKPTQVWEVKLVREGQRYFVKTLDTVGAINIWKEDVSTMDIMVEGPRRQSVAGMLHEREIPYSVAIKDVGSLVESERNSTIATSVRRSSNYRGGNHMTWNSYHRLDVIYDFMKSLVKEFPYICSLHNIGKSVEGRPLLVLKISNSNKENSGVWIDGSIHSREWVSTAVVTYIADTLARTFGEQPESVTNKDWYFLPVLNPDGYEYTHTQDRMWRKNRARYGECVGVDLNRNFSFGWGENGEEGSSDDPGNIFFRGPEPFSEPETEAVRRAIIHSDTEFKVFLSVHSYGEVIIFPWGYTGDPCPSYVELLEGGTAMSKAIYETSGRVYKVGSTKDLMYYAAGTSIDWSYAVANIPYSYMLELRDKKNRFLLPKEDIVATAAEVYSGVLRLMDFVDKRCKSTQSCVCPK